MFKSTMPTLQNFPLGIGPTLDWVNMSALGTSLTGICRWDENNFYVGNQGFVSNKVSTPFSDEKFFSCLCDQKH
jgi:hypothetical protein